MPYVRTVKTASGATAVRIVHFSHRGSRDIEHIGSARDEAGLELLEAVARQGLAAGHGELDLSLDTAAAGGPLPVTVSRMGCLLDALGHAWRVLGLEGATGGDEVFGQLVVARIIEPVSKPDSLRVLEEAGLAGPSYGTLKRRLRSMRSRRGGRRYLLPARRMRGWARPAWCSMTCPRCISEPMWVTGSGRAGSPRSDGWNRRSPSACSRAPAGSR